MTAVPSQAALGKGGRGGWVYLPHLFSWVPTLICFTTSNLGDPPSLERRREPQAQLAEPPSPSLGIFLLVFFFVCWVVQAAGGQREDKGNITHGVDTWALFFEPWNSTPPTPPPAF